MTMMQRSFRFGLGASFFVLSFASAKDATARDFDGVVHLSLDGSILDYRSVSLAANEIGSSDSATSSTASYGIVGSGLGFGVGIGITSRCLLGAKLVVAGTTLGGAYGDQQATSVQLTPRIEYVFGRGTARPFIAGLIGIDHEYESVPEASATSFAAGGGAGVHLFLTPSFSLDPSFTVLGYAGSERVTGASTAFGADSLDYSLTGYRILLSIGMSGWLGRSEPDKAEPAPAEIAPALPEPGRETISVRLDLPNQRELYLEAPSDPVASIVVAHLSVPEQDSSLAECAKIRVFEGEEASKFLVTARGERARGTRKLHFVAGSLPVHALTVLARPDSSLTVCGEAWALSTPARRAIHAFLAHRLDARTIPDEPLEVTPEGDEGPAPEAAPPAEAVPAPTPVSPSVNPSVAAPPSAAFPNAAPLAPAGPPSKRAP